MTHDVLLFFILLSLTFVLERTPLRFPFQWMETFFHELSHGLAALASFGWVHRIALRFNGSGCCTTSGGMRIFILPAGYLGAAAWGTFIYLAGWILTAEQNVLFLQFLAGITVLCSLLWVRDFQTLLIMTALFLVFALPATFAAYEQLGYLVEFFGLYTLHSAIKAPLALIDGRHTGDGAALADLTVVFPEGFWIFLWFLFGMGCLVFLLQWNLPPDLRFFS